MASEQITIRLDQHIIDDLKDEAKKRNQPLAALARTFIMDGPARYDAISEKLLQSDERIERRLQMIESITAASLHVLVEQQARGNKQNANAPGCYLAAIRPFQHEFRHLRSHTPAAFATQPPKISRADTDAPWRTVRVTFNFGGVG